MSSPTVAVFGSSSAIPGDPAYRDALDVGRLLAESGFGVANGGYSGVMEAVSRGAAEAGGRVIGVTAPGLFPGRTGANEYVTEIIETSTLTARIDKLVEVSSASIAMPGSIGTLTELIVAWNDASIAPLRGARPQPVVAVRDPWEAHLEGIEQSLAVQRDLITFIDSPREAIHAIQTALSGA